MIKKHKCINCGGKNYKLIFNYTNPDKYEKQIGIIKYKKKFNRKIYCCKSCDMYFSNYIFFNNPMDKIYENEYRKDRKDDPMVLLKKIVKLGFKNSETKQRIALIRENIKNFENSKMIKIQKKRKLLDIGGASGIFAFEFKNKNWSSTILDPSKQGNFIKKLKVKYIQKKFDNRFKMKKKYDLVTLIYTLEHILDPVKIIKNARKMINKNGLLYIEVPHSIAFKYFNKSNDIFNSCHLWFWNSFNLSMMLNNLGFEIFLIKTEKEIRGHYSLKLIAKPR
tara:strand:- start:6487 stop:7323 length:837 start_codon:yes stop_codon:yes gene_type:complete